jgi:hypothetical protein
MGVRPRGGIAPGILERARGGIARRSDAADAAKEVCRRTRRAAIALALSISVK